MTHRCRQSRLEGEAVRRGSWKGEHAGCVSWRAAAMLAFERTMPGPRAVVDGGAGGGREGQTRAWALAGSGVFKPKVPTQPPRNSRHAHKAKKAPHCLSLAGVEGCALTAAARAVCRTAAGAHCRCNKGGMAALCRGGKAERRDRWRGAKHGGGTPARGRPSPQYCHSPHSPLDTTFVGSVQVVHAPLVGSQVAQSDEHGSQLGATQ
jgi:hypothetical protein